MAKLRLKPKMINGTVVNPAEVSLKQSNILKARNLYRLKYLISLVINVVLASYLYYIN